MNPLPNEVYSVATVREIDSNVIADGGIAGFTLMTRAAAAAVLAAGEHFPLARRWQVVCGAGNNAGDGYVVARLAASEGIEVSVLALADPLLLVGDAALAWYEFASWGGEVSAWSGSVDATEGLIVDALLGSGLMRDVQGDFAAAVDAINASSVPVMALDIPTGLHGDSGAVLGTAIRADLTVTFVGLKQGLFLGDAREYCGALCFSDLDIPPAYYANRPAEYRRIDPAQVEGLLPRRRRAAHKGNFGHVLIVGGGRGMPGAALLAGEGALRAGAGRVSIATDPSHAAEIVKDRPELMVHGIKNAADLRPLMQQADVVAVGPGLGRSDWAADIMDLLQADGRPAVWDADALNWLASSPNVTPSRVITPHPGEAATLLGQSTADIQADRRMALRALQRKFGGVAVLKGAGTLVSGADGVPWLCTAGNPGMAAPGMGDVLTGIIAGLMAQGLSLQDAANAGVDLHARAGDRAAAGGERGLIASDLLAEIRALVNA
ncbi:MAG: NAD(P)H-hydrate dehydratase [Proteobacteria bacterium]|nr:NAD(P)H-hydrate dehydratase [Pseudomonadota bacterium]